MVHFSKWKVSIILGIVILGLAFAAPNLLDRQTAEGLPSWLPHEQVNLGLDLQGGSHLLLEVEINSVVRERLEGLVDGVRIALRKDRIRYTGLGQRGESVTFMVRKSTELEKARKLSEGVESNLEVVAEGNRVTVNLPNRLCGKLKMPPSIKVLKLSAAGSMRPARGSRPFSAKARIASWSSCQASMIRSG